MSDMAKHEYSKQTTDRFLNLYRQLETMRDNDQSLYSYYKRKYYEKFEEYRQIRNYLSHEEYDGGYPVAVSSAVNEDLQAILIKMGKTCLDICTKDVKSYTMDDLLLQAYNSFATHGVTYIPVIDNRKRVKGMITANKLLLVGSKRQEDLSSAKISDFEQYFAFPSHSKRFIFLGKGEPMARAESEFSKIDDGKRLGLIIVTEHGEKDEAMLGVISIYDVVKEDNRR